MTAKKYLKRKFRIHSVLGCPFENLRSLSNEQLDYIFSNLFSSVYLDACPGSGKTEVIGWKIAYEFLKWKRPYSGIAITTFTNSAVNELFERIHKRGGENCVSFPHFVGTFDSWMHNYVLQPYAANIVGYKGKDEDKSFRIIDSDSSAGFLLGFQTLVTYNKKKQPISVVDYHYDLQGEICGDDSITDGILKQLSKEDLKELKDSKVKFFRNGFCTYSDAEMLTGLVLRKKPEILSLLSKRFPVIIIDECQDLSIAQIDILEMLRNAGTFLHFIGDLNQSIYEFRKVNPNDTAEYIKQIGCKCYKLSFNFRSCQPIVNVSQAVLGIGNGIKGKQLQLFKSPCILLPYNDNTFEELPSKYEEIIRNHQLDPDRCAIVARGKSTLSGLNTAREFYSLKAVELIAHALGYWFSKNKSSADIKNAVLFLGKAFSLLAYNGKGNRNNYYCPEKINAIDWRLCLSSFFDELNELYPFIDGGSSINWTNWVLKLKKRLEECWHKVPGDCTKWEEAKNKLRSPQGRKDQLIETDLTSSKAKSKIRTTTIHSVKGETLDAILLVSHKDKTSQGGHFSHWIKSGEAHQEHLRFAYVAFSRPKHLLIIAMNPGSDEGFKHFTEMGFELYQ